MLNRVILMGRLTADPELKTTNSGISVARFTIAVDRGFVRQGEERKADFINIVCWRQQAEFVCKYFNKGAMIALEGRLQTGSYQAKDGSTRYTTDVVADSISFTGERRDSNNAGGYNGGYNQSYGSQQSYSNGQSYGGNNQPYTPSYQQTAPATAEAYQSGLNSDFQDMPLDDDLPF